MLDSPRSISLLKTFQTLSSLLSKFLTKEKESLFTLFINQEASVTKLA